MSDDPNLKTIRELVYYFPVARPDGNGLVSEVVILDEAEGDDSVCVYDGQDVITFRKGGSVTVNHSTLAYKTDRYITRKRRDNEPSPTGGTK